MKLQIPTFNIQGSFKLQASICCSSRRKEALLNAARITRRSEPPFVGCYLVDFTKLAA
jgi:hypothetical protein